MELPRRRLPESKGECEMIRTITANVKSHKTVNELAVIDWDDDKYGEPTEENVLKASHVRTVKAYMGSLEDKLNELTIAAAMPTPELPEKPGYYLTQQHMLLLCDMEGDWSVREFGERPIRGFWEEGSLDCYERDPKVIYAALGPAAFPLVPLGEVILPSEHIKKDKED